MITATIGSPGEDRRESGVDDFLAEATPERKLELIKQEQAQGRLVR